jgi:hypothetical protein
MGCALPAPGGREAGRDDWLVFSMPTLSEVRQQRAEPRPSDACFAYWEQLRPGSELEVEMHFAAMAGRGPGSCGGGSSPTPGYWGS